MARNIKKTKTGNDSHKKTAQNGRRKEGRKRKGHEEFPHSRNGSGMTTCREENVDIKGFVPATPEMLAGIMALSRSVCDRMTRKLKAAFSITAGLSRAVGSRNADMFNDAGVFTGTVCKRTSEPRTGILAVGICGVSGESIYIRVDEIGVVYGDNAGQFIKDLCGISNSREVYVLIERTEELAGTILSKYTVLRQTDIYRAKKMMDVRDEILSGSSYSIQYRKDCASILMRRDNPPSDSITVSLMPFVFSGGNAEQREYYDERISTLIYGSKE